jgi:hypothetical protein
MHCNKACILHCIFSGMHRSKVGECGLDSEQRNLAGSFEDDNEHPDLQKTRNFLAF